MEVLPITLSPLTTSVAAGPVNVLSDPTPKDRTKDITEYTARRYCDATNLGGTCLNTTWSHDLHYENRVVVGEF